MKKPVVLVVMDGVGLGDGGPGDAVAKANTPNLCRLLATCPHTRLKAHGSAVGLPTDDDMGNSWDCYPTATYTLILTIC